MQPTPSLNKLVIFNFLQEYEQHQDEADPERIKQMIDQSIKDAEWIVNKVNTLIYEIIRKIKL